MKDIRDMEGKIIDTRMNDLRIYEGRCPTLRAQRDGVLYVKNHTIYQLTGYEALLLQGFPKEYADRVKGEVSDRTSSDAGRKRNDSKCIQTTWTIHYWIPGGE